MPRHPRIHVEGLLYHVVARGDRQNYESVKLSLTDRLWNLGYLDSEVAGI